MAFASDRSLARLAALLLVAAIAFVYANSLRVAFRFDDTKAITENPTIRTLASREIFLPPNTTTVAGRPVVNASLALNYALGGEDVRGYHALNVAIHAAAALALFGLVRRTTGQTPVAFAAALLWALHPLQTESVTYVVQRAEALMGLFYLLTLYSFARGWLGLSVGACLLGMATKEVMVSAPLVVALYDRVFVGGAWSAVARRRTYYAALAATWLLLAVLVRHAGDRAGTAGFSTEASVAGYAATQAGAILRYLQLAAWPHPLVFDYGPYVAPTGSAAALACVAFLFVTALVVWGVWRRPRLAFAAIAFSLVLAPTSSVLPIATEPVAEHRMYLPLAALMTVTALGVCAVGRRAGFIAGLGVAAGLGALTLARNAVYADDRALWGTTVAAAPDNPRAHYSLALALADRGDDAGVEAHLRRAIALRPDYVGARHAYATWLTRAARRREAEEQYRAILATAPDDFPALNNLGLLAFQAGELATAAKYFTAALQLKPGSVEAHNNLGCVRYEQGDWTGAQQQAEEARRLDPRSAPAHYNLGNALARQGRLADARACYEQAVALDANYVEAHVNLAAVLEPLGERAAAIAHYRAALQLRPDHAFSRQHLEALLAAPQR